MRLDEIVPWGRNLAEYTRMFALNADDLRGRLLDCGGGPSSFNAELTGKQGRVVSCDPLYFFSRGDIARRIAEIAPKVMAGALAARGQYLWNEIPSPEALKERRLAAMALFLEDYAAGRAAGRYLNESLPALPFKARAFELALSSHLLFLYSAHLDEDFHLRAIREMCRVAKEARIFPLVDLDGNPSPHLEPVLAALRQQGCGVWVEPVPYEFQRGANRMLRVSAPVQVQNAKVRIFD